MDALNEALCTPDGLCDVTRIEFEVLAGGLLRWTAWQHGRRLITAQVPASELEDFLYRTEIILWAMAAEPPEFPD